jgi:DNA-binding CsgD family transcriptional regulator
VGATVLFQSRALTVVDYRCSRGPNDRPFTESHRAYSIAYVRKGSFGCVTRGKAHDLVAGSLLVGHPGDEYTCVHEHHGCGDECLSFQFSPEFAESLGLSDAWRTGAVPPLAELLARLTPAELQVLEGFMRGDGDKRTAGTRHTKGNTVRNQLTAIEKKLGVRSRAELMKLVLTAWFQSQNPPA